MKRIPLYILGLFLTLPGTAQEAYTINASAGQVASLSDIVAGYNNQTCLKFALVIGCTQAQACTAANAAGGSGCSAAQARAANARIFPQTLAGRDEYVTFQIAAPTFLSQKAGIVGVAVASKCAVFLAMNQTAKDAELTSIGFPTGGTTCPYQP